MKIKAYETSDILDDKLYEDNKYDFDYVLRRRLSHLNTTETQRAKTKVMVGMVALIFRFMMTILMRELIAAKDIQVKRIGFYRMQTFKFNNNYRGYGKERQKQKEENRCDMPLLIDVRPVLIDNKIEYYHTLHGLTKKRYNEAVKDGMKYLNQ